jgi:hypothetical protein
MPGPLWQRTAHVGEDRRTEPRVPCVGDTQIDVLDPRPQTGVPARVLDVGTLSLRLALPIFLAPGTLIRIRVAASTADAEVRYCTCEGAEYHAGVRLEEIATP